MTANIWARSGPYRSRAPLLRRQVGLLAPHLLALQEVEPGPGESNQAEELFGPLGYSVVHAPREGPNRADPGIAVASRSPILDRQVIELPHGGAAVAARMEAGGERFWFCSAVPMGGWPHQEAMREEEVVVLDRVLGELAAGDDVPPVLAGDFDATPDAASIRFLSGLQSLQGRSTQWRDAWVVAGDGSPGYTWSSDNPYVAPFAEAVFSEPVHHRRIDYVFVGSPFLWRPRVLIRSCEVALRGRSDAAPSDHWGVVADLDLDGIRLGGGRGLETWEETATGLWPSD